MSSRLQLDQVTRCYHPKSAPALESCTLDIASGEILALVGKSGSGKTTLLRLISGLEAPDRGEIRIGDRLVAGPRQWVQPEQRQVGMVFQDGALFPHLTVEQNICYGLQRQDKAKRKSRCRDMLDLVGMGGFGPRYPHELSGGERQRLALARALAPEPSVVLLDEPFSNLDPDLRLSLRREVGRILRDLKTTTVFVTHDTDDALHLGDRVAVLHEGKILQVDRPGPLYNNPVNAVCARMFGPANLLDGKWIRPETMYLNREEAEGAYPVEILSLRDAGRHCEIVVSPLKQDENATWVLYDPHADWIRPGVKAWVRHLSRERPCASAKGCACE